MKIAGLDQAISSMVKTDGSQIPSKQPTDVKQSGFLDYLNSALGEVNSLQAAADDSARKLALGDESYLHNTIIAFEKAYLALQLTVEVRNRVVEAYQEIMRIQL